MNLVELIEELIEEQGLTEEEATAVAAARFKVRQRSLARSSGKGFPVSAQQYENGVDYGEETPEEARERWIRQEMADPNGIYGGGATSGGVFGEGAIAVDHFDPGAVQRELNMRNQVGNAQTQVEMLKLLQDMRAELRGRSTSRELPSSSFRRQLGSKKRR